MVASIEKPQTTYGQLIAGRMVPGSRQLPVISPATEQVFAHVPDATRQDLALAIDAARAAFPHWAAQSYEYRAECLVRFADAIAQRTDVIAELLTREQGKPLARSRAEIGNAVRSIKAIASIQVEPETLLDAQEERIELHFRPLGVVGGITAWNVPVILAAQKIAQALYTGNTMVLKPSPYTPLATLALGEASVGILPDGVLNIVTGGNDLGAWLTSDPGIDKISFTGSGPTGKAVLASAARHFTRTTLELGGNDAAILLPDADLDVAVPKIFASAFNNAGQICMAIKRLYVHEDIYETVLTRLAEMAEGVVLGDGLDDGVGMGPVQNRVQYEKLLALLDDTKGLPGVRIVAGGEVPDRPGYFIRPTVVADIADGTRLVDEEPFGPILPVIRFTDAEDALARANASPFGLSGSIWSGDVARGRAMAARLEVGTAWVNRHGGANGRIPFGGAKTSGLGREHGLLGLQHYMEAQVLHVG